MVLKRSKFGINTGNSLCKYRFQDQKRKGILKHGLVQISYQGSLVEYQYDRKTPIQSFIDIGERRIQLALLTLGFDSNATALSETKHLYNYAEASTVEVSLNKRNRWLLVERLLKTTEYEFITDYIPEELWYHYYYRYQYQRGSNRSELQSEWSRQRNQNDFFISDFAVALVHGTTVSRSSYKTASQNSQLACIEYANSDGTNPFVNCRTSKSNRWGYDKILPHASASHTGLVNAAFKQKRLIHDAFILDEDPNLRRDKKLALLRKLRKQQRKSQHNAHFRGLQRLQRNQRSVQAAKVETMLAEAANKLSLPTETQTQRDQVSFFIHEPGRLTTERCFYQSSKLCRPREPFSPLRSRRKAENRQFILDAIYDYQFEADYYSESEEDFVATELDLPEKRTEVVKSSIASIYTTSNLDLTETVETDRVSLVTASVADLPEICLPSDQIDQKPEFSENLEGNSVAPAPTVRKPKKAKKIESKASKAEESNHKGCACSDSLRPIRGGIPASLGKIWIRRPNGQLANRQQVTLPPLKVATVPVKHERADSPTKTSSTAIAVAFGGHFSVVRGEKVDRPISILQTLASLNLQQLSVRQSSDALTLMQNGRHDQTPMPSTEVKVKLSLPAFLSDTLKPVSSARILSKSLNIPHLHRDSSANDNDDDKQNGVFSRQQLEKLVKKKLRPLKVPGTVTTSSVDRFPTIKDKPLLQPSVRSKRLVKPHLGRVITDSRFVMLEKHKHLASSASRDLVCDNFPHPPSRPQSPPVQSDQTDEPNASS